MQKFPSLSPTLYVKRQWVRERQEGVTYVIQPSIAITAIVVEREAGGLESVAFTGEVAGDGIGREKRGAH